MLEPVSMLRTGRASWQVAECGRPREIHIKQPREDSVERAACHMPRE